MTLLATVKPVIGKILRRYPFFRVLPRSALRAYAGLEYHRQHGGQEEIASFARTTNGPPLRYMKASLAGAQALFRTGQDDPLEHYLSQLEHRFPDEPAVWTLRADLETYRGDHERALRAAETARLLEPSSAAAVARVVRLSYFVLDRQDADLSALAAMRSMPNNATVLWAVCRTCGSPKQYERIKAEWDASASRGRADLLKSFRALAVAAARGGEIAAAIDLYRRTLEVLASTGQQTKKSKSRTLATRRPWAAIEDLCRVLDGAAIPFFFAAGTALGLVREGRPIATDGDIDLGVLECDWDRGHLVQLFTRDPQFDVNDRHPHTDKVGLVHRGGSPIDIFRFYREDGKLWHDAVFVRWGNTPFDIERRTLHGAWVPLPHDVHRYLTECYADWRIPNPSFDAFTNDAPNVETIWPEYHRFHHIRRAYNCWTDDNYAEVRRELERAGEDLLVKKLGSKKLLTTTPASGAGSTTSAGINPGHISEHVAHPTGQDPTTSDSTQQRDRAIRSSTQLRHADIAITGNGTANWSNPATWSELSSRGEQPPDYDLLRTLWLDSPRKCHQDVAALAILARAAAAAGAIDEALSLIRKAILLQAARRRRMPADLAHRESGARALVARWPEDRRPLQNSEESGHKAAGGTVEPDLAPYFALLSAVTAGGILARRRRRRLLRRLGEGSWLDRL